MEYFEIFDLPPKLDLDLADLERRFHSLSRQHHPDYHTTRSGEEQERALQTTAMLNDAYRTLRDPTRRVDYLIRSNGLDIDRNKVPQALLAQVFEINEELEQIRRARTEGRKDESSIRNLEQFREAIAASRREYEAELRDAAARWDDLIDRHAGESERRTHLTTLADIVARSAYLRNLEQHIEDEVSTSCQE